MASKSNRKKKVIVIDLTVEGPCCLLDLPPECRNRIYEFVLVTSNSSNKITVGPTYKPPSLTQTNRQLRAETKKMHYSLNHFHFTIIDHDATLGQNFVKLTGQKSSKKRYFSVTLQGECNWDNLERWWEMVHESKAMFRLSLKIGNSDHIDVAAAAHEIARQRDVEWDRCFERLERLRRVVVMADGRWLSE